MQVPAPFEYERATSVDHAIGLLERLGAEARLVAGGHSLLPMMKLRLANLEYLIDINDLHDELGYVRVGAGRGPDRCDDPAPRAARVRRARRALPDLRRRRAGDRRPGRAQPRHDRRLAVPGRPVRGPVRGLHDARRQLRDPRRRRRAGGRRWRSSTAAPTRPRSGTTRCSPRSGSRSGPAAPAPTRRSSAGPATGRSSSAGAAVWMDGGVITDARVGLAAVGPNTTGIPAISEALRGQAPVRGALRAGRRARGGELLARSPTSAAPPTTSGTSPTS